MPSHFLHSSHLCSDVDTRSLYGITNGSEGFLIITTKGMISKFNVASRKHVTNFTSKSWEPYTAAGIYNPNTDEIISVAGSRIIHSVVDGQEKTSKHKFSCDIYKLISRQDENYVVYSSGDIKTLKNAINNRKTNSKQIIANDEHIKDAIITDSVNAFILTSSSQNVITLYHLEISENFVTSVKEKWPITKNDATLNAVCITPNNILLTFWSTGELCQYSLADNLMTDFPGNVSLTLTSIMSSKPATIIHVSESHAAILGMDASDEGSLMILFDTKFGVVNSTKKLKMYRKPPLAWVVAAGIVVVEAGALALIPYTLDQSNISTMFSSKLATSCPASQREEVTSESCCSWPSSTLSGSMGSNQPIPDLAMKTLYSYTSSALALVTSSLTLGSLSQSITSSEVINHLITKRDIELLNEALRVFNNIPEKSLVSALDFFLHIKANNKPKNKTEKVKENGSPFSNDVIEHINLVLSKPFTASQILPHVRIISFDNALKLITHLNYLLDSELGFMTSEPHMPSIDQACTWLTMFLDSNYTQLIMTPDHDVHESLMQCLSSVSSMKSHTNELIEMQPTINIILKGQNLPSSHASAPYSLERLIIN